MKPVFKITPLFFGGYYVAFEMRLPTYGYFCRGIEAPTLTEALTLTLDMCQEMAQSWS